MRTQLCAIALAASFVVGCGGAQTRPDALPRAGAPLAAWVPADTPYFFGAIERAPEGTWSNELTRLGPSAERLLAAVEAFTGQQAQAAMDFELRALLGVLSELRGRINPQGLAQMGLDLEAPMIMYGIGLMPAVRMQLASGERFREALDRILGHLGLTARPMTHGGRDYRQIDVLGGELQVVVAIEGDEAAAAMVTPSTRGLVLDALLLGRLGGPSLASTDALSRLARTYDVRPWSLGFVDTVRLFEATIPGKATLNGRVAAALGVPDLPPECPAELRTFLEAAPRIAFGIRAADARRSQWFAQLELAPDVAAMLTRAKATVPGLGADVHRGSFLTLGLALDFRQLALDVIDRMAAPGRQPYRCDVLRPLGGVAESAAAVREMLHAYPNFHGFDLAARTLHLDGLTPRDFAGTLVLASPQAAELVQLAANFVPELAQLGLQPDARPVRVQSNDAASGLPVEEMWVALTPGALGITFGDASPEHLSRVLTAAPALDAPLAFSRLDRAAVERLDFEETVAGIELLTGDAERDATYEELIAALRAFGETVASRYGEMITSATATPTGVAFVVDQALNP